VPSLCRETCEKRGRKSSISEKIVRMTKSPKSEKTSQTGEKWQTGNTVSDLGNRGWGQENPQPRKKKSRENSHLRGVQTKPIGLGWRQKRGEKKERRMERSRNLTRESHCLGHSGGKQIVL